MTVAGTMEDSVDLAYPAGAYVECDQTAGHLSDAYDQILNLASLAVTQAAATVFNADGSITETYADSGLVVTTSFGSDGSITEAYGSPLNVTKTTRFNADGSITETTV